MYVQTCCFNLLLFWRQSSCRRRRRRKLGTLRSEDGDSGENIEPSKKEPLESLHAGDLQYYSQTISTHTSLSTDVFSCSKKTEGTHLYGHRKLAVNKSPAVLCFHKSKQRFCEQGIPKLVVSLEIFRFQYKRWYLKYLNNTIKRSA